MASESMTNTDAPKRATPSQTTGGLPLDALLQALDADREMAGHQYEKLRQRLVRYFRWNNDAAASDLADIVLDRLAGKLAERRDHVPDVYKFAFGIARLVALEVHAKQASEWRSLTTMAQEQAVCDGADGPPGTDAGLQTALVECLQDLPAEDRYLLEKYYMGEASERISNRKALAAEFNVNINTLRNRALRLRQGLGARVLRRAMARKDVMKSGNGPYYL